MDMETSPLSPFEKTLKPRPYKLSSEYFCKKLGTDISFNAMFLLQKRYSSLWVSGIKISQRDVFAYLGSSRNLRKSECKTLFRIWRELELAVRDGHGKLLFDNDKISALLNSSKHTAGTLPAKFSSSPAGSNPKSLQDDAYEVKT